MIKKQTAGQTRLSCYKLANLWRVIIGLDTENKINISMIINMGQLLALFYVIKIFIYIRHAATPPEDK